MRLTSLGGALSAALTLLAAPLAAQGGQSYTLPGDRVTIYDLAGQITIEAGTGSSVVVQVTRLGSDASRLQVETGPLRERQTLRVIFPGDRIVMPQRDWNGNTEMWVRDDGTFGDEYRGRGEGRRVTIGTRGDGLEAQANLSIAVPPGKSLSVHLGVGRIEASNVNGSLNLDGASADITAHGIHGSLNMDTGSGNVTATDVEGGLHIDTGSGDVRVTGAHSGGISIDTGSGDVTGSTIQGTSINIDTGSGNIDLSGTQSSEITLETGSGDVRLTLQTDIETLDVETGSGNVTLTVPEAFGATVDLETSSGNIVSDVPLQVTRRSEDRLTGRIGDGRGRMSVETGSGDVTIRR